MKGKKTSSEKMEFVKILNDNKQAIQSSGCIMANLKKEAEKIEEELEENSRRLSILL